MRETSLTKLFRVQWVLPVNSPPIKDGAILVAGDRIVAAGKAKEVLKQAPSGVEKLELEGCVLIPGFINPHTHLENTHFAIVKKPQPFNLWLAQMVKLVRSQSYEDALVAAADGVAQSLKFGVTCIGEFSRLGASFVALSEFGMIGVVFKEFICLDDSEVDGRLVEIENWLISAQSRSSSLNVGIGPHAPYTVTPNAFKRILKLAANRKLQFCIHASESPSERKLVEQRKGIWRFWLGRVLKSAPIGLSPIRYLDWLGALRLTPLLVHCVQVDNCDISLLAERKVWVVHCPRSNANLKVGVMPLAKMLSEGVKVCLATDGLASVDSLSPLDEIRFAFKLSNEHPKLYPSLPPKQWLKMATLYAAAALGLERKIGSIEPGKRADLAVFNVGSSVKDPIEALVFEGRETQLTVVAGKIVYPTQEGL